MTWFFLSRGQRGGPVSDADLRAMVAQGRLAITDLVWREGMQAWAPAHEALGVAMPPPPPPAYAPPAAPPGAFGAPPAHGAAPAQKERLAYVLLGVFLGALGIHNFFAGYTGRAVAQLLVTILLGWLVFPLVAVWIWNLVEVVTVKQDADGVPFK